METCIFYLTGKLYAALGRRGGRVVGSDLQSGSNQFRVEALLPVAESFKFVLELRTHTSGLAAPQMLFSHWEVFIILCTSCNYSRSVLLRMQALLPIAKSIKLALELRTHMTQLGTLQMLLSLSEASTCVYTYVVYTSAGYAPCHREFALELRTHTYVHTSRLADSPRLKRCSIIGT